METEVRHHLVVIRKGGNYVFDQSTTDKLVAAIYGAPGSRDWVLYNRTEFAMRVHVGIVERAGIAARDEHGWTRPWLHTLVDLQHVALNSPVRDALRFLHDVYGSDADEMLRRFIDARIHIANHSETLAELDFINQTLGCRHVAARHPDTEPTAEGAAA
jgi:hypothetical protein